MQRKKQPHLYTVERLIVAGLPYRNDNTEVFLDSLNQMVEYRLYEESGKMILKFEIATKQFKKVRMTPRTI